MTAAVPRTQAALMRKALLLLVILATPMAVPTLRKVLGNSGGFLHDLGFQSGPTGTPAAWALALVTTVAYVGFAATRVPAVRRTWMPFHWSKLVVLPAAVAAATVEEAVFRRMVMDAVMHGGGGAALQVAASGLAFGTPHAIFGLIRRDAAAARRAAVITGILGVLLGAAYALGRRSLAPCITAHFLITLALEPGLLMAAISGAWRSDAAEQAAAA